MNAYLLSLSVLIILGGKLVDIFGKRNLFLTGVILFSGASILCALSPNLSWLIVARVLQGVGGACIVPARGPLLKSVVPDHKFGQMFGISVAIASTFMIIGPALGGFFATYLSWRWIFWLNVPIAGCAITWALLFAPTEKQKHKRRYHPFDWMGFLTLSCALITLVFALMEASESIRLVHLPIYLAISALAFILFLTVERRCQDPFVDLSLFQNTTIARCIATLVLAQCTTIGMIFAALFLQHRYGLSAGRAGVFLVMTQLPLLFIARYVGKILDKQGPRLPVCAGAVLIAIGGIWSAASVWYTSPVWLLIGLIVQGAGYAHIAMVVQPTALLAAPKSQQGMTVGLTNTMRQVGSSVSLAIFMLLQHAVSTWHFKHLMHTKPYPTKSLNFSQLHDLLVHHTLPHAIGQGRDAHSTHLAVKAILLAYTTGFSAIMLCIAVCAVLILWIAKGMPNQSFSPKSS